MAIVYEDIDDDLVRIYSDAGFIIHGGHPEGDYEEVIELKSSNRKYEETDIIIESNIVKEEDALKYIEELKELIEKGDEDA